MKKRLTLAILSLCYFGGFAQNTDPVDAIYERYSGDKFSIAVNLDAGIFQDFDIDIDTDDLEQRISGTIRRLRFIGFDEYRPGLRSEKEIVEELLRNGYELAIVPSEYEDENSQMLIFKKKGQRLSPHLIIIVNDREERKANIILLSGSIEFKSSAS